MNASPLRIGIAGAGAIGCTLAARLAVSGHKVKVLARGETLSVIRRDGIHLSDLDGQHHVRVEASDDAASLGEQDLIFLCAKAQALATLLPQLQPMIGAETVVIPVVNGVPWWYFHGEGGRYDGQRVNAVDPQSILSQALDLRHVIGCVVFITAHCPANAVAESHTPHLMIFGEPDNCLSTRTDRKCRDRSAGHRPHPRQPVDQDHRQHHLQPTLGDHGRHPRAALQTAGAARPGQQLPARSAADRRRLWRAREHRPTDLS